LASRRNAADPAANKEEEKASMQVGELIAAWLPIALGIVMIGAGAVNLVGPGSVRDSFARWGYPAGFHRVTGGLEVTAGALLLIPATSRAGAIGSVAILLAAVMTLIRHRDWKHLPVAVVLTAVAAAVTIRG
jgi:membrane protein HdeD